MKEATISLTGKDSHHLKMSLSQGSLSIGTLGMDKKKFDILVDPNLSINWKALDESFPNSYVAWPRWVYYYGNDLGFIDWSANREVEQFSWCPNTPISADFSKTKIHHLSIITETEIDLVLGIQFRFSIEGELDKVAIRKVKKVSGLSFYPKTTSKIKQPYQLPEFIVFNNNNDISISLEPIGQAFDCKSLSQFNNLVSISLSGNFINLSSLSKFENLKSLAIRYVPNLEGIPNLNSWKKLNSFIGWNIEEIIGKRLRTELRQLKKKHIFEYSTVSKLRKKTWFVTEYGIPFSAWENKKARKAVRSYKATLKELTKAKTKQEIKKILIAFIKEFNDLSYIETSEREDVFTAVNQLRQTTSIEIDSEEATEWFDANRNY